MVELAGALPHTMLWPILWRFDHLTTGETQVLAART